MKRSKFSHIAIFILILGLSAVSTGGSMYEWGGGAVAWLWPSQAQILAAIVGMILMEGMAAIWFIFETTSETDRQMSIARASAWVLATMGMAVTASFFIIQLQGGALDAGSEARLRVLNTSAFVIAMLVNTVAIVLFVDNGPARKLRKRIVRAVAETHRETGARIGELLQERREPLAQHISDVLLSVVEEDIGRTALGEDEWDMNRRLPARAGIDLREEPLPTGSTPYPILNDDDYADIIRSAEDRVGVPPRQGPNGAPSRPT